MFSPDQKLNSNELFIKNKTFIYEQIILSYPFILCLHKVYKCVSSQTTHLDEGLVPTNTTVSVKTKCVAMLTIFQLFRCLLFLLVLALACRTTSCFISDCPSSQVLSPDNWEQLMSFYLQGYYAKDSKRMFVGGGIKRMFIENKAKPKDKEKINEKPPAILKAMVNKRDLRFLYNILYNDKNKKQNCELCCCCNRNTINTFLVQIILANQETVQLDHVCQKVCSFI